MVALLGGLGAIWLLAIYYAPVELAAVLLVVSILVGGLIGWREIKNLKQ